MVKLLCLNFSVITGKVLCLRKLRKTKLHVVLTGGVEVICRNFVNCNSRIISTTPSLISTMMQNMNGRSTANDKKKKWETENSEGLQNFAPLGRFIENIFVN